VGSFSAIKGLPSLGGFAPTGQLDVALTADRNGAKLLRGSSLHYLNQRAEATLTLRLPSAFSIFGGTPPSVTTVASVTNDRGLVLDALHAQAKEVDLGGARLTDVLFDYLRQDPNCPRGQRGGLNSSWQGGGNLYFGPTGKAGLAFRPPPSDKGIGFCGSSLSHAGGSFTFGLPGPPPPQVFPGVFLDEIGFSLGFDPTRFSGHAKFSVGDVAKIDGALLAVFASGGHPYTLHPDTRDPLHVFDGQMLTRTTFAVAGKASLSVPQPIGDIDLGSGYFMYGVPDYVRVGGTIHTDIPGGHVEGGADGELNASSGAFNLDVHGKACIVLCYGGEVLVSSAGIAACATVSVDVIVGTINWTPGFGYRYGDTWPDVYFDGCDVTPFRASVARAAVSGPTTFTVPPGSLGREVRLVGAGGGAPSVEVRGPDGETASTAGGPLGGSRTLRILRSVETGATWVGVVHGKPGTYTITTLPGSPEIAGTATADLLAPARVKATVAGSDTQRTLSYDVAARPGQRVTFVEHGPTTDHVVGSVASGRGTLRFTPADGAPGVRRIVARIALDGLAREQRNVATFTVASSRTPARPAHIRARHAGAAVVVSWRAAPGAAQYGVVVTPAGGATRLVRVPGTRHSVRVAGIPGARGGTVTVRALTRGGDAGRPASARFAATRSSPSRFRALSELRRARAK
jgi:hypothetical protein